MKTSLHACGSHLATATMVVVLSSCSTNAFEPATAIHVDQVGYATRGAKLAVVVTSSTAGRFTIHLPGENEVVFEGELGPAITAPDSGEIVRIADFSPLSVEGTYEVRISEEGRSVPFRISDRPYGDLLRLTTRAFYGQRCGTAVDLAPDHPAYSHDACHLPEAYHVSSGHEGERESTGGWHDAGDYGRYVVNSGISTGTLLWAWELFPETFRAMDLAIPESDDATPDLLDEIRWNLEWMLSMQDDDGGVWHKQTSEAFAPIVPPVNDPSISFVIGTGSNPFKSSCATGNFAAVMAIAARVYEPFDRDFSVRTRRAAEHAWRWLAEHPDVVFGNPEDVTTGEYGDERCHDERLWAAAEIWRTTGDSSIGRWFVAHAGDAIRSIVPDDPPSWNGVGAMAAWTYAMDRGGELELTTLIRRRSVLMADRIVERSRRHGYRIPLETDNYVWGSNGVAANYGLQLLVANELQPDSAYVEAAIEIVHYLLGRNPLAISWVTGAGSQSVAHPHHRPSMADGSDAPWPGLLAGGPNRHRQDPAMRALAPETPPAKMYLDEEASFATNEIAINWNAPLVFVLAGVSD